MDSLDVLQNGSPAELEEWFLGALEKEPLPVKDMLAVLEKISSEAGAESACGLAELMLENPEAVGRTAVPDLLQLLCRCNGNKPEFGRDCRKILKPVFSSRVDKAFLKNVGFGELKPSESLRRLAVLAELHDGTLCYEKTWGFGQVKRIDDFYEKVTIDFVKKAGHEMSMAYAAESLRVIDETHLLARLHNDRDGLMALVAETPAEVVRITLRSYGNMPIADLKDYLVDEGVVAESDWKNFWDAARKELKNDALVHIPSKRSEDITLLASADEHLQQQFSELNELRDPESILKKVDAMETEGTLKGVEGDNARILADKLAFAVWGAEGKLPDHVARALLMAERYNLVDENGTLGSRGVAVNDTLLALLESDVLTTALLNLPVRAVNGLLEMCASRFSDLLAERLIESLPQLSASIVMESISVIKQLEQDDALNEFIAELLAQRSASPALIIWILKNIDEVEAKAHSDRFEILRQGVDAIEWPAAGDQLRAQHQIRSIFESGSCFADQMSPLSHEQRIVLLNQVQSSRGWDESDKRAVMAGIMKVFPELHALVASDEPDEEPRGHFTSWRTYRQRQEQFKKLMEVEIPENSREIAVARSYGDLRENAEYKYAKEHQRILYRRRDEMEEDLKRVKGYDFSDCGTELAGMGTIVTIRRPDGTTERFSILGEWDRDEDLNIISNLSRLAQLLDGHKVGDEVMLPSADGEEPCTIVSVKELDDAVKAWLAE